MDLAQLIFAGGESSLSVRKFDIKESISDLFEIRIEARSPSSDLDFEDLIGQDVAFNLRSSAGNALVPVRTWNGLCARCEQVRVETNGLSTYEITIVPQMWLLTKRRNHRLFQHESVIDIAHQLLAEWEVPHQLRVEREAYPPLEVRMQYGESDFNLLCRLLEEAGISFFFEQSADEGTVLVLSDEPHGRDARIASLPFNDDPENAQVGGLEYATAVRIRREIRPAKVVVRDFDFRKPRYELVAQAAAETGLEERLEQFHYAPGAFKTEGHQPADTPTADDLGCARACEVAGVKLAKRMLEGERARRRRIKFDTNAFDAAPGVVLSVSQHPRSEMSNKLLMTKLHIHGEIATPESWNATGTAVVADSPFQPEMRTAKPKINGVQSAIIVGPEEETVYTDEFGRVRAQFHWDRQGQFDAKSSVWMRVSQGWAGPGYGLFNLPRVGHEVLVGFVDGDVDQPIIVGRVFNGAQQVPYPLPGSKMMSGWKSDSNSNIILFDDTPGDEMFYTQAEKDRLGIVKRHEAYITGGRRSTYIGTANKTLVTTTDTLVACGKIAELSGMGITNTTVFSWKAHAGFNTTLKAGNKVDAHVQPVLPFITALLDVKDAKIAIAQTLPAGAAPDLKQLLPIRAGGPPPTSPQAIPNPNMTFAETEDALKKELTVVGDAFNRMESDEVEQLEQAETMDVALDNVMVKLEEKGGPEAVTAFGNAQTLTKQLQTIQQQQTMQNQQAQQNQQQLPQQTGMFTKLLLGILEMVIPKTKIEIKHNKIKLETKDAKIEMTKEDIKLEAKGDITIKADGKVKIEGSSVAIEPFKCC